MYLTLQEMRDLTDRASSRGQVAWLRRAGWPFVLSALGRPKVLRAFAEKKGGLSSNLPLADAVPNWSQWESV